MNFTPVIIKLFLSAATYRLSVCLPGSLSVCRYTILASGTPARKPYQPRGHMQALHSTLKLIGKSHPKKQGLGGKELKRATTAKKGIAWPCNYIHQRERQSRLIVVHLFFVQL